MNQSKKPVIELSDLIGERIFRLPKSMGNQVDLATGELCVYVGINGKNYYIPVDKPTPLPYPVFCVLREMGILDYYKTYKDGEVIK